MMQQIEEDISSKYDVLLVLAKPSATEQHDKKVHVEGCREDHDEEDDKVHEKGQGEEELVNVLDVARRRPASSVDGFGHLSSCRT